MQATFLGTGTSSGLPVIGCDCPVCRSTDPRNNRYRASILLRWNDRNIIVDTGPEFRLQVLRAEVRRLDAVLLTHEHADHIVGLDDLRFFTMHGGTMPVFGDVRTVDCVRSAFRYIFDGTHTPGTFRPRIEERIIRDPFDLFGETVTPIRVFHGDLPIMGFRVGGFAYVTDCSRIPAESEALLQGLDVLVLGALRATPHPTHFSLPEAIEATRRLAPRRTFFTHIAHEMDHATTNATLPQGMTLAYDGLTLDAR